MNFRSEVYQLSHDADFLKLSFLYKEIAVGSAKAQFNWDQRSALEEIRAAKNLVFQSDDVLRAFISFRVFSDRIEITSLGTKPNFRNQGLGKIMINQLKIYAAEHGFSLWLEVHEGNQTALNLYIKMGFKLFHRRKRYYSDGADAIVMHFRIKSHIQS